MHWKSKKFIFRLGALAIGLIASEILYRVFWWLWFSLAPLPPTTVFQTNMFNKLYASDFQRSESRERRRPQNNWNLEDWQHIYRPGIATIATITSDRFKWRQSYTVSTTRQGLRTSLPSETRRTDHILLFGCSNVFGTGVSDEETVASQWSRLNSTHEPYNFGIVGHASSANLLLLSRFTGEDFEDGKDGIGVYFLSTDHIARVDITKDIYNSNPRPLVHFNESGEWEFTEGRSFHQRVVYPILRGFVGTSLILQTAVPYLIEAFVSSEENFVNSLVALRDEYRHRTEEANRFIVVLWPEPYGKAPSRFLRAQLEVHKFEILDLSKVDLKTEVGGDHFVPFDGHPNAKTTAWMAKQLHIFIKRNEL